MWWLSLAAWASEAAQVVDASGPIAIDGVLDEPSWRAAPVVNQFLRFQPTDGGDPPGETEVRFLQDEKNLYVAVSVRNIDYRLRARISQRESINADDQIGIYLDTFHDEISGYIFYFNALGIQQDIRHNAGRWNSSWDTVLRSRGEIREDGFDLEIAFPWRSLKFPGEPEQTWGLIVTRKVPHEGAKYSWPQLERGAPRIFGLANDLEGVRPPRRGSGLELVPSITASDTQPSDDPRTPLEVVRPSLDVRFGLTPDLGIAATLNPDFSQVESDVSDVRLNARFAFNFPERRPFFLDGSDWFEDVANTLYSRSVNSPVYGVKLGGREGPASIGVLHALDRSPLPSFTEGGTPGFSEDAIADRMASNTLVRARTDAFGRGFAGITLGDKRILGGGGEHQTFGSDLEVPLGDRWFARSSIMGSRTTDGEQSLLGTEHTARVWRASGIGSSMRIDVTHRSPGFRKELGFLTLADRTTGEVFVDHTFTPEGLVDTWVPFGWVKGAQEGNGDGTREFGHGQRVLIGGVHNLSASGFFRQTIEQTAKVDGGGGQLSLASNLGRALDLRLQGNVGRVVDFALLEPATSGMGEVTATLRPTPGIRTDTTVRILFHQPRNHDLQRTQLIRNRLNWQFTRELGARWVTDYSAGIGRDPRFYNALLLTWLRNPGTAVWLGGSLVNDPDSGRLERTLFAKATLLVRP